MTRTADQSKPLLPMPDRHDVDAGMALLLALFALVCSALTWWRFAETVPASEDRSSLVIVLLGTAVAAVAAVAAGAWAMGTVPPRSRWAMLAVALGALSLVASGLMLLIIALDEILSHSGVIT